MKIILIFLFAVKLDTQTEFYFGYKIQVSDLNFFLSSKYNLEPKDKIRINYSAKFLIVTSHQRKFAKQF
ncbi:hypothetical protein BpHYR1_051429 [Brachionus plicatilis]|uniref:Uncharacterized protein n=1 Tax=Brachionus plicatilis TaxID=10195 RepID=A0A3M7SMP7_BRAPC|nr:hypothetical protein BpHYR1_051429 [Brachionus plicatilis]